MLCFKHRPIYGYTLHNFGKLRNHLNLQQIKNAGSSFSTTYAHGIETMHIEVLICFTTNGFSKGYYCCSLFLCKGAVAQIHQS